MQIKTITQTKPKHLDQGRKHNQRLGNKLGSRPAFNIVKIINTELIYDTLVIEYN